MAFTTAAVLFLASVNTVVAASWTDRALNSMGRLMHEPAYEPRLLADLHAALAMYGLEEFADTAWKAFDSYAMNKSNPWGKKSGTAPGTYMEYNPRQMDLDNITVYEPCNFASNMVYYRTMTGTRDSSARFIWPKETTRALVQSLATSSVGSAFFHATGSLGNLPEILDALPIATLAYTVLQAAVARLDDPVLSHLTTDPRNKTAVNLTQEMIDIIVNEDLYSWNRKLSAILYGPNGVPGYKKPFSAIGTTVINLILPPDLADTLTTLICNVVGVSKTDSEYLNKVYAPAFRNRTSDVHLTFTEKFSLALKGSGTLLKFLYAFLWQEHTIKWYGLHDPKMVKLGGEAMPYFNMLCNGLTGWKHPDPNVQASKDVYPGDSACRLGLSPHALWHEQNGNGLLDLIYLANEVDTLLANKLPEQVSTRGGGGGGGNGAFVSWLSWWGRLMWWNADHLEL